MTTHFSSRPEHETAPASRELGGLRAQVEEINFALLDLLSRRARLVDEIQRLKSREQIPTFIPEREQQMLTALVRANPGPFPDDTIAQLFKEIFRASVHLMEGRKERALRVSRVERAADLEVVVGDAAFGREPVLVAGPCAVESEQQMDEVARCLAALGLRFMRGGAFKPRSSPYAFQGLGARGLEILAEAGHRYGLRTVTEVMDTRLVELVARFADVLQVGSRNMYNYDLLREVGRTNRPVLLKRGLSATLEELLWAAEYVAAEGNGNVILCERGIRSYDRETRNTLDISAIPLLRQKSHLPVIVDVSHAAGRKDILVPLARAALAAGASGLMVEAHPCPAVARSDSQQQLDLGELARFVDEVGLPRAAEHVGASAATATAATVAALRV
jgi:3-deoxy-7-phosphoheptulonate synthase/chorismate mutase